MCSLRRSSLFFFGCPGGATPPQPPPPPTTTTKTTTTTCCSLFHGCSWFNVFTSGGGVAPSPRAPLQLFFVKAAPGAHHHHHQHHHHQQHQQRQRRQRQQQQRHAVPCSLFHGCSWFNVFTSGGGAAPSPETLSSLFS